MRGSTFTVLRDGAVEDPISGELVNLFAAGTAAIRVERDVDGDRTITATIVLDPGAAIGKTDGELVAAASEDLEAELELGILGPPEPRQ